MPTPCSASWLSIRCSSEMNPVMPSRCMISAFMAPVSTRIGSPDVGMPAAIGLGVNTGDTPPNGATLDIEGSEQDSNAISPRSVMRLRYAARQPM